MFGLNPNSEAVFTFETAHFFLGTQPQVIYGRDTLEPVLPDVETEWHTMLSWP
jgi:hypothetical protein